MPKTRHYFVDEAGDGTLFDGKGRVIIGSEGCSRFFVLGCVDLPDPAGLAREMTELRARLLVDPYFSGIPSMQPDQHKTALAFHAKDDVAEVRREVFALLRRQAGVRFFAVVKDKRAVLDYVLSRNEREPRYRYEPNESDTPGKAGGLMNWTASKAVVLLGPQLGTSREATIDSTRDGRTIAAHPCIEGRLACRTR